MYHYYHHCVHSKMHRRSQKLPIVHNSISNCMYVQNCLLGHIRYCQTVSTNFSNCIIVQILFLNPSVCQIRLGNHE